MEQVPSVTDAPVEVSDLAGEEWRMVAAQAVAWVWVWDGGVVSALVSLPQPTRRPRWKRCARKWTL